MWARICHRRGVSRQWIFWLNVPVGVLVIPLALARVKEMRGPYGRLDRTGLAPALGGD
jgi:hypothetical protein